MSAAELIRELEAIDAALDVAIDEASEELRRLDDEDSLAIAV